MNVITLVTRKIVPKPDGRQVRGRPGQQLAGLPVVVEGGRQPLQVRVDVGPHGLFHPGDRARLHPAAQEAQQGLADPQADRGRADRQQQPALPVADRPVDHGFRQQRDGDLAADGHDGAREHERQLPTVGAQVGPDTPE
jgi:hypothetical protein